MAGGGNRRIDDVELAVIHIVAVERPLHQLIDKSEAPRDTGIPGELQAQLIFRPLFDRNPYRHRQLFLQRRGPLPHNLDALPEYFASRTAGHPLRDKLHIQFRPGRCLSEVAAQKKGKSLDNPVKGRGKMIDGHRIGGAIGAALALAAFGPQHILRNLLASPGVDAQPLMPGGAAQRIRQSGTGHGIEQQSVDTVQPVPLKQGHFFLHHPPPGPQQRVPGQPLRRLSVCRRFRQSAFDVCAHGVEVCTHHPVLLRPLGQVIIFCVLHTAFSFSF